MLVRRVKNRPFNILAPLMIFGLQNLAILVLDLDVAFNLFGLVFISSPSGRFRLKLLNVPDFRMYQYCLNTTGGESASRQDGISRVLK